MNMTKLAISLGIALFLCAAPSEAVTIDTGAYLGRYYISGAGGPFFGGQTVTLAQGTYFLDTGAGIGGSSFSFDVDAAGNVGNLTPAIAASVSGNTTIVFNTTPINIATGAYAGRYFLSIFGTSVEYHGNATDVIVLPGLTYTVDDGAEAAGPLGASDFTFSVDALGNVVSTSPSASVSGSTLSLNTVPVQINPGAFSARYYISPFYPTPFTGAITVMLMPGLLYTLDDGAEIGTSAFAFLVDAAGNVSTESAAASGSGSVLTLNNVVVHLDGASSSGSFSISGYPNLSSSVDVVLIPTLDVVLTTADGSAVIAVPNASGFAVTFGGVTVTTASPYKAVVQPPIKSDGSSIFKTNRGVVPVKFTLSVNDATTCQLPAATISLTRASGATPGIVNQSDYLMPSDNGPAFRIDSCQYVYNLGTSTLGAGQYVVQITINGVAVGSAKFGLN
jgi:hypothetical protein